VRQVARLGDRPLHHPLAVVEQRVEIVDERLHFCRVVTRHPALLAAMHRRQTGTELIQRGQAFSKLPESGHHAGNGQ